jgi:hypothetical protein
LGPFSLDIYTAVPTYLRFSGLQSSSNTKDFDLSGVKDQ